MSGKMIIGVFCLVLVVALIGSEPGAETPTAEPVSTASPTDMAPVPSVEAGTEPAVLPSEPVQTTVPPETEWPTETRGTEPAPTVPESSGITEPPQDEDELPLVPA